MAGRKQIFGILSHLVPMTLGWILFLIGSASLTGLTSKIDCGRATDTFSRCGITKGLVVVSWIDTSVLLPSLFLASFNYTTSVTGLDFWLEADSLQHHPHRHSRFHRHDGICREGRLRRAQEHHVR